MRRLLALMALCATAAAASSVTAGTRPPDDVLVPSCGNLGYGGRVAPREWSAGCTAGSANLQDLSWSGWGDDVATASGSIAYTDCDPSCATAPVYLYPAELRVERIRRCASALGARRYYTRASVVTIFPPDNPSGRPAGPSEPLSFTVACPRPSYAVGLGKRHARLGPFVDGGEFDADRIELLFGEPATTRRVSDSLCRKRWPRLGMTAEFVVFGFDDGGPCSAGSFFRAVLTARRWRMPNGVHPGGAARAARRSSRRCTHRRCGVAGYGFALHRSECAPGRYPGVIAQTSRGRVRRLIVYKRWCE
jgi:hypothetical protein